MMLFSRFATHLFSMVIDRFVDFYWNGKCMYRTIFCSFCVSLSAAVFNRSNKLFFFKNQIILFSLSCRHSWCEKAPSTFFNRNWTLFFHRFINIFSSLSKKNRNNFLNIHRPKWCDTFSNFVRVVFFFIWSINLILKWKRHFYSFSDSCAINHTIYC